jgi:hypothetical protein
MVVLVTGLISCTTQDDEITLGKYRITYKANVESGLWFGSYTDSAGNSVCLCEQPYQLDGWLHSFATSEIPQELMFEVESEFYVDSTIVDKPDVTASIYINGELMKTRINALADGKTRVIVLNGIADIVQPLDLEMSSR